MFVGMCVAAAPGGRAIAELTRAIFLDAKSGVVLPVLADVWWLTAKFAMIVAGSLLFFGFYAVFSWFDFTAFRRLWPVVIRVTDTEIRYESDAHSLAIAWGDITSLGYERSASGCGPVRTVHSLTGTIEFSSGLIWRGKELQEIILERTGRFGDRWPRRKRQPE